MAAPTKAARVKILLANSEPSTQEGIATFAGARSTGDFRGARTMPGIKR
jgi:hypothetical protein